MIKQEQIEKLTAVVQRVLTKNIGNLSPSWVYELGAKEIAEALVEEGNVVVLPCKVGDEFWYVNKIWNKACIEQVVEFEVGDYGIVIVDTFGRLHSLERIYFTKEAVGEAVEEIFK